MIQNRVECFEKMCWSCKDKIKVSVELTLDCDCKDLKNNFGHKADDNNILLGRCGGPARTEFLLFLL